MIYDIIIVGAGPAGIYGTFYATYCGLKVLLVEIDQFIGGKPVKFYPVKPIHDFPGMIDVTGQELVERLIRQLESVKDKNLYEIKTNVDIVNITKEQDIFCLTDQHQCQYQSKYVILATGYTSFHYQTIEAHKVMTQKSFHHFIDDCQKFHNKNVVVLGGGDSAFDQAYLLRDIAKQVTLVHRSENYRAHHDIVHKVQKCPNIRIISSHVVEKVADTQITITNHEQSQILDYDELLICWGVELMPNNLSHTNILNKMYKLEVNDKLESLTMPNLYGVGNINNRKEKDLITVVLADMIKVISDILAKEKISITY